MLQVINYFDVVVIGGGPAGLAAALSSYENGAKTLIIERENKLGGILKQCIHDGFGLITFNKKLSGPEYATNYISMVKETDIDIYLNTFVKNICKENDEFIITLINSLNGVFLIKCKSLILATGCRERTSKQVFINGSRPAGVYTAGTSQYFVNILGYLPCKNCVILGSGDIGLIMARRLTLEGAKVIGVYEAKSEPSGLSRNIVQCLNDYDIPLYLSHTVTEVIGNDKVEGVKICKVDKNMMPIKGTEEFISCDGVVLSVGLIPENELAETLGIELDPITKGPIVDQNFMTNIEGIFSCGNSLHVNDLVDYVSESGKLAGDGAASYSNKGTERKFINISLDKENFLYRVPQKIDVNSSNSKITLYFRSKEIKHNVSISLICGNNIIQKKHYSTIRPPEMEKIEFDYKNLSLANIKEIKLTMENKGV